MPFVNDWYGCILESANPHTGAATLAWRPLHPIKDNAQALGAEDPGWSNGLREWAFQDWIKITAKEWAYDDAPPFSWIVTTRPATTWLRGLAGEWANVDCTMLLFVAPHVEVEMLPLRLAQSFKAPTVDIIRLDSMREVPLPSSEPNLGALIGPRPLLEYFHGVLPAREREEKERSYVTNSPGAEDTNVLPSLNIVRKSNTIIFERKTQYKIVVTLDTYKPSFFRIQVSPPYVKTFLRNDIIYNTPIRYMAHDFTIYHDALTKVHFEADEIAVSLGRLPVHATLRTVLVPASERKEARKVTLPLGKYADEVDEAMVTVFHNLEDPDQSIDLAAALANEENVQNILPEPAASGVVTFLTLGIGFVPVLGQLYDIADIISIAVTGRDLMNAKRTNYDIMMIAAFSLLGAVGDIARKVDMTLMDNVARKLFPNHQIVSPNPHFSRGFARSSFMGSPALLASADILRKFDAGDDEVLELFLTKIKRANLTGEDPDGRLRQMNNLMNNRHKPGGEAALEAFMDEFLEAVEVIMIHNAQTLPFREQPYTLHALATQSEHFIKLIVTSGVEDDLVQKALKDYDKAIASGDFKNLFSDLNSHHKTLADAVENAIADQIRKEVLHNPSIQRRARAYNNHKANKNKPDLDPYEYLSTIAGKGTEGRDVFEFSYGRAAWEVLTGRKLADRIDPEEFLERTVEFKFKDQTARISYKKIVQYWMNNIDTYAKHNELSEGFVGFRQMLNSDHLLEARFRKTAADDDYVLSDEFRAMLVPANNAVARALNEAGVAVGWYVHTHKTNRMRELIPHGREREYTTQEIADAYQYFWVHEMGMKHAEFDDLYRQEFHNLHLARQGKLHNQDPEDINKITIEFTKEKSKTDLLDGINAKRVKMGITEPIVEAKVGERVSDTPGFF